MPSAKRAARRKHAGWSRSSCRSGNSRSVARQVALNTADHKTIAGAAMMNRPVAVVRQASSGYHVKVGTVSLACGRRCATPAQSRWATSMRGARPRQRAAASSRRSTAFPLSCPGQRTSMEDNRDGDPRSPKLDMRRMMRAMQDVYPRQTRNGAHRLKRRSKRGLISSKTGREAAPMAARFEPVPPGMSLGIARFSRDPTEIGKGSTASINHCKRP